MYELFQTGKDRKSVKHGSGIPGRMPQSFASDFLFFPIGKEWKSPENCFHVPLISCRFRYFSRIPPAGSSEIRSFPEAGIIDLGINYKKNLRLSLSLGYLKHISFFFF
jgi:hypothetical protein